MKYEFAFESEPFQEYSESDEYEFFDTELEGDLASASSRERPDYVRWVQQSLNRIKDLRLAVNGILEPATRSAIRDFQRREGLPIDGIIDPVTERALIRAKGVGASARQSADRDQEAFLDNLWDTVSGGASAIGSGIASSLNALTDCARIEDRTSRTPKDKRKGKPRDMTKVYALVLHQTAGNQKNDPPNRYDKVTAHFVIKPNGQILQLHPLSAYLYASHCLNAGSVAVEFAGNFPDTKGKWYVYPNGASPHGVLTAEQIEAGRCLVRHLIRTMGLSHILAHRQSSSSRTNDPGPDIWYNVGQWAVENLGLKDGGPTFTCGTGKPIPDLWRNWGKIKPQPELGEEIDPESPQHTSWSQPAPIWRGVHADREPSDEIEAPLIEGGADSEQFLGDLWAWFSGDSITHTVVAGQEYGGKFKSSLPPGLPGWARHTSAQDAAAPHVEKLARSQGLGEVFVRTAVQMARTESGARFALPAIKFNARPKSERRPGESLVSAWGVFSFNRDAWTSLVPREKRRKYRSWIANGERGCEYGDGCVFPWDCTAFEEIALPINRYAELFREVRAVGGSETDAVGAMRLWHISPKAHHNWLTKARKVGFDAAWQQVSVDLKARITRFLKKAGVL